MSNGVRTPVPSEIGLIPMSDRRIVSEVLEVLAVWLTNDGIELSTVFHTARVQDFFTVNALTGEWEDALAPGDKMVDGESCTSVIQTS